VGRESMGRLKEYLERKNDDLVDILESTIEKINSECEPRNYGEKYISVTEVFGCKRAVVCRILKKPFRPVRVSQSEIRVMESGLDAHARLEDYLDKAKITLYQQEKVFKKGYLAGTPDRVIKLNRDIVVVDFKTVDPSIFEYLKKTKKPRQGELIQVNLYIYLTGANYGLLLYENRLDFRHFTIKVNLDKAIVNSALNWCESVMGYVKKKELPPVECEDFSGCIFGINCEVKNEEK
jgi:hypothetical protein